MSSDRNRFEEKGCLFVLGKIMSLWRHILQESVLHTNHRKCIKRHGDKHPSSENGRRFPYQMNRYQLLKDYAP